MTSRRSRNLTLSGNYGIRSLPAELGKPKNLVSLDLSRIETPRTLPSFIGGLFSLRRLTWQSVGSARQHTPPSEICDLTDLRYLDVSGIGLRSLATRVGDLENLRLLDLKYNRLSGDISPWEKPLSLAIGKMRFYVDFADNPRLNVGADRKFLRLPTAHNANGVTLN